jgi:hypothetical protein
MSEKRAAINELASDLLYVIISLPNRTQQQYLVEKMYDTMLTKARKGEYHDLRI